MAEQTERIGALWLKETAGGKKYFAGQVTVNGVEQRIVIFKNERKQPGEKFPDYNILAGKERS